jgi:hypothetical protein
MCFLGCKGKGEVVVRLTSILCIVRVSQLIMEYIMNRQQKIKCNVDAEHNAKC